MLESQRHQVRLSEIRVRLNELNGIETLDDEQRSEMDTLGAEYRDVETRYRAAVVTEDEHETQGSQDADPETRATVQLLRESRMSAFMDAAIGGRTVEGREAELMDALSIENAVGAFPLRLLDTRYDALPDGVESRQDVATSLAAAGDETTVNTRPWLDRVFVEDSSAAFLGVTRESVPAGDRRAVVVTAGTTAAAVARGAKQDAAAFTISTVDVEPRRMSAAYLFRSEDRVRHPALEAALRRDLRMVMSVQFDEALIQGDGTQYNGLAGTTNILTNETDLPAGASKPARNDAYTAFTALVDGTYASRPEHVSILLNRTVYNYVMRTLAVAQQTETVLEVVRRTGFRVQVSDHLTSGTAANTFVGVASKARGLPGSLVQPVWEAGSMIVDPYSRAGEGETRVTMNMLFGQPTVVRQDNWRRLKAVA